MAKTMTPPERVTLYPSMGPHWSTARPRDSHGHEYVQSTPLTDAAPDMLAALKLWTKTGRLANSTNIVESIERLVAKAEESQKSDSAT